MNSTKQKFKHILLDIEGTTSSISFVHEVLFPYAAQNLESFLKENQNKAEIKKLIDEVLEQSEINEDLTPLELAIKQLQAWIKADKKIKVLKELQGLIWQKGYEDKAYQGHIYRDAYEQILNWHKQGVNLYIYSSGSVQAQKLIFGHTKYGDLNYLFKANFDTNIGNKKEAQSYLNITKELNLEASELLFLSDNSEELLAAQKAGLKLIKIARPEDGVTIDTKFNSVQSFFEID